MMYPGLMRRNRTRFVRQPEPEPESEPEPAPEVEAEPAAQPEPEPEVESAAETEPRHKAGEGPAEAPPEAAATDASAPEPELKSEDAVHARVAQAESVSKALEEAKISVFTAVAETLLFFSILLLKQSMRLSRPQRLMAGLKLALVTVFVFLYPAYALVAGTALAGTYYYVRFFAAPP